RYVDHGRLCFERVRGATSLTERSLQLGLAQRLQVRPPRRGRGVDDRLGRDGAGCAARRALPRRRDRDKPVPAAGHRRHGEAEPPHRPGPHALGSYPAALRRAIAERGALHDIPGVPEDARRIVRTSHEIGYAWHVRHQAAFQRCTDNGVARTINLPHGASEEDVARAYLLAWE